MPREPGAGFSLGGAALTPWLALLRARAARVGLRTPDAVFGLTATGAMTTERLADAITRLPRGLSEIYTHPATADVFPGCAPGYRYRDELAALTDPGIKELLREKGLTPCGYRDVAASDGAVTAKGLPA